MRRVWLATFFILISLIYPAHSLDLGIPIASFEKAFNQKAVALRYNVNLIYFADDPQGGRIFTTASKNVVVARGESDKKM